MQRYRAHLKHAARGNAMHAACSLAAVEAVGHLTCTKLLAAVLMCTCVYNMCVPEAGSQGRTTHTDPDALRHASVIAYPSCWYDCEAQLTFQRLAKERARKKENLALI